MKNNHVRGIIAALLSGICWGYSGCCGQYIFTNYDFDPILLACLRMTISGVVLTASCLFWNHGRDNLKKLWNKKRDLLQVGMYGVFGLLLAQLSYLMAIDHTNAATATVIQYTGPAFVIFVVCITEKRKPTVKELVALFLAMAGVFLIATHGKISSMAITPKGLFWCLLAAFAMLGYTLLLGDVGERVNSIVCSGVGMLIGGVLMCLAIRVWRYTIDLDFMGYFALFGVAVIGTLVACTLYVQALSDIGPVKSCMLASIETVASALVSVFWLHTNFQFIELVGFAAILSTVFILSKKEK